MSSQIRLCALAFVLALSAGHAGAAEGVAQDWPAPSRKAAEAVTEKYGAPQEQTATMMIWHRNGPWIRTVVHKVGAEHDFPAKHSDVLEQSLPYKVSLNLFSAIATFNGSVIPDRTRGTLTAYGASEAENVLSLNLARAVVRGELTAEQARDKQVVAAQQLANGQVPDLASKLTLDQQQEGDVSDPDTAMIMPPGQKP
ncbi:hypothetical protein MKK69_18510 [Methylobacterium sp. J-026]|uniref:hypothetical protein n=1 Tax=Methylobacterium sp. J-026 TaxID=2836624 RepID=UPI001FB9195A|nr:hypothetical protein [Methylobacterium sp. J-026]MCJ2136017.1 hypothetical protein [Methylobacterium sp. J-026]